MSRPWIPVALLVLSPFRRWAGSREKGEAPARRSKRDEILGVIRREPGITVAEVLLRLPYGSGTVYHHLANLAETGAIRSVLVGRRRLLYAGELEPGRADLAARAALGSPTRRRIARAVLQNPGATVADLCRAVGDAPRVVYYHVTSLHAAGVVEIEGRRFYRIRAAPGLRELLEATPTDNDTRTPVRP